MKNVLYLFSGEKAQGAEIVIERLMMYNAAGVNAHLFIAPGNFANNLLTGDKPYKIRVLPALRRLFRNRTNGISFWAKAISNHFKVSYKVYRYLKKEHIEIIHANNIAAASYLLPVLVYAKLFLRKRTWIWSDHDMGYSSKIDKAVSKMAVRLFDCTLAVSGAVAKKYMSRPKIQVLYNGLDAGLFKPDTQLRNNFRNQLNVPATAIVLGMAAKITPGKGHLSLIEVFNLLTKSFPGIYLVLAGGFSDDDPGYNDKVKNAITANKNIVYLGFLDDMIPYYNGCDIIISNSNRKMSESLGTTIYEAMAFEKIVVGSNTGGTSEIITDAIDGFLFPAEHQHELSAKLDHIIANYNLLGNVRKMAREKVNRNFNILTMVKQYNQVINRLTITKG